MNLSTDSQLCSPSLALLGEWKYRQVFQHPTDPKLCIKVQKPYVRKRVLGLVEMPDISAVITGVMIFGDADLNRTEFHQVCTAPQELKVYLPDQCTYAPPETVDTTGSLILSKAVDYDWRRSLTLEQTGIVDDMSFWQHIDRIVDICRQYNYWLFDALSPGGKNICVRWISSTERIPFLCDVKRDGKSYPLQVDTWFRAGQERKLLRRVNRLKDRFEKKKVL